MTKKEYMEPIKDEYIRQLSQLSPKELFDNGYNPGFLLIFSNLIFIKFSGPTKPDGSVNFECHCVSHLVASPCGYAFRKMLSCEKAAKEEELEDGKCVEEAYEFMRCAMRTQCFRS